MPSVTIRSDKGTCTPDSEKLGVNYKDVLLRRQNRQKVYLESLKAAKGLLCNNLARSDKTP